MKKTIIVITALLLSSSLTERAFSFSSDDAITAVKEHITPNGKTIEALINEKPGLEKNRNGTLNQYSEPEWEVSPLAQGGFAVRVYQGATINYNPTDGSHGDGVTMPLMWNYNRGKICRVSSDELHDGLPACQRP